MNLSQKKKTNGSINSIIFNDLNINLWEKQAWK